MMTKLLERARQEPHIWAWVLAIAPAVITGLIFLLFGASGFWACVFALIVFALAGLYFERYLAAVDPADPMAAVNSAASDLRSAARDGVVATRAKAGDMIDEVKSDSTTEPSATATGDAPAAHAAAADSAQSVPADKEAASQAAHEVDNRARVKPETLSASREGGADDLKRISGVGPKLEELLNSLGFYHYDQIANWSDSEIAWVDDHLGAFRGRIERDEWIAQARALMEG